MTSPISDRRLAQIRNRLGENVPVPPKRKRPDNIESRMQAAVISWWGMQCRAFGVPEFLLFAVGNGGKRSPITGAIMKREGVRAGTADLLLMVKRGKYGALAIEMKAPDGRLSPEQIRFLEGVNAQGYAGVVAYSVERAMEFIRAYLAGEL